MWPRIAHASVRLIALSPVLAALWSFARLPGVPWPFTLAVAGVALLTALRPLDGLLAVAALVPVTTVAAQTAGAPPFRAAEVVALAAIAGWLLRTAFDRTWPVPAAVRRPAAWFAAVVVASALVELAVGQAQRDYPLPFLRTFFSWLALEYVIDYRSFPAMHAAALLLEGTALLAASTAACRRAHAGAAALARMLVVGAAAAALLNVVRLATSALRTESPLTSLLVTLEWVRLNVHFGDVNAAGSQFALVLLLASGLIAAEKRWRPLWIACAACLAAGLWLAGSRTAFGGFVAAAACWMLVSFGAPRWPRVVRPRVLLPLAAALVLVSVLGVGLAARSNFEIRRAVAIRFDLTMIAARMTASHPAFGIGIGRFYPESGPLMTPQLRTYYANENAHNNFLQILAELGIVGLAAFLWLLWSVLAPALRGLRDRTAGQTAAFFAVAGFLLTALGGHPLLIPEVAVTFWLALAVVAAALPVHAATAGGAFRWPAAALALAALAASVPVRAGAERAAANLEHVAYGLGSWQTGPSGERFRTADGEATFFVRTSPHNEFRVELPLRVEGRPVVFRIDVDDHRWMTFTLAPGAWREVVVAIPPSPGSQKRITVKAAGAFQTGPVSNRRIGPLWWWGDADGDRRADFTVFRPGTAEWLTATSSSGFSGAARVVLGAAGHTPVPRDYDGDGRQDPATHDPASGSWRIARSGSGYEEQVTQFGVAGDVPIPADYDGDDRADLALFRPANGLWAVQGSATGEVFTIPWGSAADTPVPGDYDGDGAANVAIYRPDSGEWLILDQARRAPTTYVWGRPGDVPVPADYDGDAVTDVAVYRPSTRTWHLRASKDGISALEWGEPDGIPMPADYDGDGKADPAFFVPSANRWIVHGKNEKSWGQAGDVPVPRR